MCIRDSINAEYGDDEDEDTWTKDAPKKHAAEVPAVYAHCPHAPQVHGERHWVFAVDARGLVATSIKKTTVNTSAYEAAELKLMFQAPDRPGKFAYTLHVISDSYVGCSTLVPFEIQVHPAPEMPQGHIDDLIDSDDEVSLSDDDDDSDDDADDK
eukprot:TRINITY_DN98_c0_g2_i1.p2 TRINITY_DN98_c0_g2~~TRINITY_DN98_c0_g2_i1.p2  ORF type:complete len:155 (+),score=92.49 TRINITY_DN98_c0_g2_i1:54-518(+)